MVVSVFVTSLIIGTLGGYFGGLLVLHPPVSRNVIEWVRANPPRDYVVIRNRWRAYKLSHYRRQQIDADLIAWAQSLVTRT